MGYTDRQHGLIPDIERRKFGKVIAHATGIIMMTTGFVGARIMRSQHRRHVAGMCAMHRNNPHTHVYNHERKYRYDNYPCCFLHLGHVER